MVGTRAFTARVPTDGQATVELALVLPLVFAMLVLLFQVALVARDEILVVHAARDAAREATRHARPGARRRRGAPDPSRARRSGSCGAVASASRWRSTITYVSRTDLPLVGVLVPDLTLHGRSVMRVERP